MIKCLTPHWPDIAIIGSYPLPYGGISVHLQRLTDRLDLENIDYILYNTVSPSDKPPRVVSVAKHRMAWYLKFLITHRCKIVHLVSVNWFGRVLFAVAALLRPGKYALSIQGRSVTEALVSKNRLRAVMTKWLLRRMDAIIACNPDIARDCIEFAGVPETKVHTIAAFIPPALHQGAELPDYIADYIASHSPVLSSVGWVGIEYLGCDLYGIDMTVQLIRRLKRDYPEIGMVLSVNGGKEENIQKLVKDTRLLVGDSMLVVTESLKEFAPVAGLSDLFLRPTNTDGDSVSIREALFVGTPVVASDVTPRPGPCLLFANRDIDDFELKVRKALSELNILKKELENYHDLDNAGQIINLYRELMKGSG